MDPSLTIVIDAAPAGPWGPIWTQSGPTTLTNISLGGKSGFHFSDFPDSLLGPIGPLVAL